MQEARAEAKASRNLPGIAYRVTNLLQKRFVLGIHLDVCQQSEVVARLYTIQMLTEAPTDIAVAQGRSVLHIGKKFDSRLLEDRFLRRKGPRFLVLACKLAGFDLTGFDIRLIERVDPDD